LLSAGAKLNVPNRLGICPVDAAKDEALGWFRERGFSPNPGMMLLLSQQEAIERQTLSAGQMIC
jgi:hypothetical protein